jgi:hypothetical protein
MKLFAQLNNLALDSSAEAERVHTLLADGAEVIIHETPQVVTPGGPWHSSHQR